MSAYTLNNLHLQDNRDKLLRAVRTYLAPIHIDTHSKMVIDGFGKWNFIITNLDSSIVFRYKFSSKDDYNPKEWAAIVINQFKSEYSSCFI